MPLRRSTQSPGREPSPDRPGTRSIDPVLDNLTHFLDQLFRIPGTNIRFGLDPILGLLFPGGGDALSNLLSGYIIWRSVRYGVPKIVVARMVFNVAVDYVLGAVPVIGDLFDFGFKANQRNLNLIRRHASGQRSPSWSDWAWALGLLTILAGLVVAGMVVVLLLLRWYGFPLV
ncbi:MAG: DUF4112 domain-containing protein [Acidobacteria bacterium]|nr:MAG: DUF4112 domain-containing protein [Acidobacteriota bacterium]